MRAVLGFLMMCLMLNLALASGNVACATQPSRQSSEGQSAAQHRLADGDADRMPGMDHSRDTNGGKPCPMPIAVSCCQSLPSSAMRTIEPATMVTSERPWPSTLTAFLSRSIAPDTPPPRA